MLFLFFSLLLINYEIETFKLESDRNPIILIPGMAGSQLESVILNGSLPFYCPSSDQWTLTWVSFEDVFFTRCLIQHLEMEYNNIIGKLTDKAGHFTRTIHFGKTDSVRCLNPSFCGVTEYFATIIDHLILRWGYEDDVNLKAAPYDFRKIGDPATNDEYFSKLATLIEETYKSNGMKKIILISHSMGGPLINLFLLSKYDMWKQKYIHSHLSMNGVYGGSFEAVESVLFGVNLGVPSYVYNRELFRELARSMTSIYFVMPSVNVFGEDYVVAVTPSRNYTLSDLPTLLARYSTFFAPSVLNYVTSLVRDENIGVKFSCLYSDGFDTVTRVKFTDVEKEYEKEVGPGDGTVSLVSLKACERYFAKNSKPSSTYHVSNVDHIHVLRDPRTLAYIDQWISESSESTYSFKENIINILKRFALNLS